MHVREDGTVKYPDSATGLDRDVSIAFSTREVKGDLDKGSFSGILGAKCDHRGEWGEKNWRCQVQTLQGVCPKGGRSVRSCTMPIFALNVHLVFTIFLKSFLVFPILSFSSISLH